MSNPQVSAAILSGGKSSRMGRNKALIKLDGKPIIQRVSETLREVISEIILISNEMGTCDFLQLPTYADITPHVGPLAGLITALHYSTGTHCLVVACDMPFISSNLLRNMVGRVEGNKIIAATSGKRLQPLCAIYPKTILQSARHALAGKKYSLMNLMKQFPVIKVEVDEHTVFNINTPQDLTHAFNQSAVTKNKN